MQQFLADSDYRDTSVYPCASSFSVVCTLSASVRRTETYEAVITYMYVQQEEPDRYIPYFFVEIGGYNIGSMGAQHILSNVPGSQKAVFVVPHLTLGTYRGANPPMARIRLDKTGYLRVQVLDPEGKCVNAKRVIVMAQFTPVSTKAPAMECMSGQMSYDTETGPRQAALCLHQDTRPSGSA